jgi:hypothetical protein
MLEQSLQLSQDLCDALARREEARAQGDGDSSPGGVHEALRSALEEVEALRAEKEIAVLEGRRAQEEGRRAQEAARDQATLQYAQREAITDVLSRATAQLSLAHSLAARAASDADGRLQAPPTPTPSSRIASQTSPFSICAFETGVFRRVSHACYS